MKHKYETDIKNLLLQAHDELSYSEWDFKGSFYTPTCFWCHQIAEKSLKALWLYYKESLYPLRHNLEKVLLEPLASHNPQLVNLRVACQILDQYYIPTRYGTPSGPKGDYSREQAEDALGKAKEILVFIDKIINKS